MRHWLALAVLGLAATPTLAAADPLHDDVRCAVLMNAVAAQPLPAQPTPQQQASRSFASQAMIYFVGRVDGRGAAAQLPTLLTAEIKNIKQDQAQAEANRCAALFKQRGDQVRAMGKAPARPAAAPPAKK